MFVSIAQSMYEWIESTLFGEVAQNAWYTANRDTICGIFLVVMCSIVVAFVILGVVCIIRFFARCLDTRL